MANVTPLYGSHYIKTMGLPNDALVKTKYRFLEFPLYIACSKEIPDSVINRWQDALDNVKSTGQYKQVYDKYIH